MELKVETFLDLYYGSAAKNSLELLAESGSSRKYYRFVSEGQPLILTFGDNVEENKTFLYFTEHFSKIIDNLPEVKKVSDDFMIYTQSDLGNQSLMNRLMENRESAKELFRKSVIQLVKMQVLGDENLDYSKCFSYSKFNYLLTLRDLFSFKNYFLNLVNLEFNHGRLIEDFERFSDDFQKIPFQYFVYRDFQSRNIMVYENEPYFIDYQGGMKGPVQYDLVSLIWQAKANLPKSWKDELYDLYVKEFIDRTQKDLDYLAFKKAYDLCLIERLLQVLGTYGFRGIYERKSHFLSSIEFALKNLEEIQELEVLKSYAELQKVIVKLADPQIFESLKQKIDDK